MPDAVAYTRTAIALHWLVVLAVIAVVAIGLYAVALPLSPRKLELYAWHKWLGVTILLLAIARLSWRAWHPAPPPPGSHRGWERALARATHILLYALLLAVPLSGWLMSSAAGFPVVYFGLLPLPDLIGKNKELAELLKTVHFVLNKTLLALVTLHAIAALKHHFIDGDNTLRRMLSPRAPR